MTYHGKAEGGPMDGQRITDESRVMYVNVMPPFTPGPSVQPMASDSFTYEVGSYTYDGNGLWTWKL